MADPINGSAEARNEGIEVKANDIAQQKQALKKLGGDQPPAEEAPAPKRRGRPPGSTKAFPVTAPTD